MKADTANSNATASPARPAIPDVLLEHLEEHGFLCLQRRRLVFSTEYPLRRLPRHDERIAAHWDGLVVGGAGSVRLALEKLEGEEPWEIATAARAWLELGKPAAAAVAEKLSVAPPEKSASWREAFRQCPEHVVTETLPARSVAALAPHAFAVAVDALAWHGLLSPALAEQAARDASPGVRSALARALPHAGLADATPLLQRLLEDAERSVSRRALWSAALLAPDSALDRSRRAVRGATPEPFAVRVLGLLGTPDDHAALVAAAGTDSGRPAAFWAFADMGTEAAVDSLIRLLVLPDPDLVKTAGEALEEAIGAIERKDMEAPPKPEEAREHWAAVQEKLPRGARVLRGLALPWRGEASEEPTCWLWRSSLKRARAEAAWLRREVPDGFFEALPAPDARPGE